MNVPLQIAGADRQKLVSVEYACRRGTPSYAASPRNRRVWFLPSYQFDGRDAVVKADLKYLQDSGDAGLHFFDSVGRTRHQGVSFSLNDSMKEE